MVPTGDPENLHSIHAACAAAWTLEESCEELTMKTLWGCVLLALAAFAAAAAEPPPAAAPAAPLIMLGPGDAVTVQLYGRPEFNTTAYVGDDGTIPIPLAGRVPVLGLSPADAGSKIAQALKDGQFLNDPQVTVFVQQSRSQGVSVLGAVHTPGRYVIESNSTVLDALARAGGIGENGADVVFLLRPRSDGSIERTAINLKGLRRDADDPLPTLTVKGGDSIFVPQAEQYFVYGAVHSPNMYRLEPGMTVEQAITRSGGITDKGSRRRIEIRRKNPGGNYDTRPAELVELVRADDVIRVKERIF
jgi:polysaccharide export outer membrane protein